MSTGASSQSSAEDPLDAFRPHFHFKVAELNGLPPFVGGAIGYAGYDVVRYVENLPNPPEDDRNLPDLDFAFYHTLCVFDHVEKTITVVSLADCREITSATEATTAYQNAVTQVDNTIKLLSHRLLLHKDLHGTRTIGKKPVVKNLWRLHQISQRNRSRNQLKSVWSTFGQETFFKWFQASVYQYVRMLLPSKSIVP